MNYRQIDRGEAAKLYAEGNDIQVRCATLPDWASADKYEASVFKNPNFEFALAEEPEPPKVVRRFDFPHRDDSFQLSRRKDRLPAGDLIALIFPAELLAELDLCARDWVACGPFENSINKDLEAALRNEARDLFALARKAIEAGL